MATSAYLDASGTKIPTYLRKLTTMQTNAIAKIVYDTCVTAKLDMINGLPAVAVSGDVGCGFFCVPASVDDLGWLQHVAAAARPNALCAVLRYAMQKAQAALKAYDKKNKEAKDNDRLNVAQTAFAGALNGAVASTFNDGSMILSEVKRQFCETKVKAWATSKGKNTDPESLEVYRAAIEKDNAANYKAAIDALTATVVDARTYAVARKGTDASGEKIETSDFAF
jgi:hypothetical protein